MWSDLGQDCHDWGTKTMSLPDDSLQEIDKQSHSDSQFGYCLYLFWIVYSNVSVNVMS